VDRREGLTLPTRGPNVSGTPPGRNYSEARAGAKYFDDLAFVVPPEEEVKPEPLKRVRVLPPFGVAHDGVRYFPGDMPEVPASLADRWIRSKFVLSETPETPDEGVVSDGVKLQARKRGNRPQRG
jgi:hypothetical protein